MGFRVATWNINSIRSRVDRVVALLERHDIDVLLLQETKCPPDAFPFEAFFERGYDVAHNGVNQWNGVAIVSRVGIDHDSVRMSFAGQPGFAKDPAAEQSLEPRAVFAQCGGVDCWSLYVPNGRSLKDRHFDYKIAWLKAFAEQVPSSGLTVVGGDFNVAPLDEDVWDIAYFSGSTHVSETERAALDLFDDAGLVEVTRPLTGPGFTYWDYTQGRFAKNEGMRIDFQFASPDLASRARAALIDVEERSAERTSDHAPVVVDYDLEPSREWMLAPEDCPQREQEDCAS